MTSTIQQPSEKTLNIMACQTVDTYGRNFFKRKTTQFRKGQSRSKFLINMTAWKIHDATCNHYLTSLSQKIRNIVMNTYKTKQTIHLISYGEFMMKVTWCHLCPRWLCVLRLTASLLSLVCPALLELTGLCLFFAQARVSLAASHIAVGSTYEAK